MIEADDPGFYNEDEPEDSSWACKRCHRIMAVPPEVSRLCGRCAYQEAAGLSAAELKTLGLQTVQDALSGRTQ